MAPNGLQPVKTIPTRISKAIAAIRFLFMISSLQTSITYKLRGIGMFILFIKKHKEFKTSRPEQGIFIVLVDSRRPFTMNSSFISFNETRKNKRE